MRAAIRQLFDAGIMLEDSAFRDFVGGLSKVRLEMVSMQSGVDVGSATGTGDILDVEEDNLPTRVL